MGRPATAGRLIRGQLPVRPSSNRAHEKAFAQIFLKAVADRFAPALLIDENCRILYSHGAVSRFIQFPAGSLEMNLSQLIVPELANELLTTLHRVRKHQKALNSRKRRIASLDHQTWRLGIHPLEETTEDNEIFLVIFEASAPASITEDAAGDILADQAINDELASTREHLQTLNEEMAASNEEMQALNEEVQAANEELQATNEELEASNEELQATNEELVSVNEESLAKSAELAVINSDFESVYNTIDFPVLVFDPNLCLKRANGAAIRHYDLPIAASGQHIGRLKLPSYLADIDKPLMAALVDQRKDSFPTQIENRTYQIFITPALNTLSAPQSVVLVVIDNTDLIMAQRHIVESQERLLAIMNHSLSVVSLKDTAGRYQFVNRRFEEMFGVVAGEILGKTDHQIFPAGIAKQLRTRDLETMGQQGMMETRDKLVLASGRIW
ncbi:hypothetical protein CCP4SC76_5270002 [Gammaproteobacteria bacterium]